GDLISGWEMRGPYYKGFLSGGSKGLFTFAAVGSDPKRLVVCESAIDALSLAAIEKYDTATAYLSTGGVGVMPADPLCRRQCPRIRASHGVGHGAEHDLSGSSVPCLVLSVSHYRTATQTATSRPAALNRPNSSENAATACLAPRPSTRRGGS